MAKTEWSEQELRSKAEVYCARAEHCEQEVRQKIRTWGGGEDVADRIIDHLLDNNYINPERYCRAYVHDKLLYQGWGRVKIRMMLRAHALPTAEIEAALAAIADTEYHQVLLKVANKKVSATREQQIRYLLQRGFTYDEISQYVAD